VKDLSVCAAGWWMKPYPWSGGIVPIKENKHPPSTSYKKIKEVKFNILGILIVEGGAKV